MMQPYMEIPQMSPQQTNKSLLNLGLKNKQKKLVNVEYNSNTEI